MSRRRRSVDAGVQIVGQQHLFTPPPAHQPTFDELCPPEQLELDFDAARHAAAQTTVYDHLQAGGCQNDRSGV